MPATSSLQGTLGHQHPLQLHSSLVTLNFPYVRIQHLMIILLQMPAAPAMPGGGFMGGLSPMTLMTGQQTVSVQRYCQW